MSGWAMKTALATGIATRTPAPTATRRVAPASRARAHVSGAAREPRRANGSAEASAVGPRSQMKGTWTSDASGIQWALEGIGRIGSAGIVPPTSAKIQTTSTENPCPAARLRAMST